MATFHQVSHPTYQAHVYVYLFSRLQQAVKLESAFPQRNRYMAVVSCVGRQDTEECLILGIDCNNDKATIGLVLPIWANTKIKLDGDGGFSINYEETHHLFKPVSVQAMW